MSEVRSWSSLAVHVRKRLRRIYYKWRAKRLLERMNRPRI